MLVYLIFFLLFLQLSAFFSGVEAAFVSLNRLAIIRVAKENSYHARKITYFLHHFDHFVISILLLNLMNNSLAVIFGTEFFQRFFAHYFPEVNFSSSLPYTLTFIGITAIMVIFAEVSPKRIALRQPRIIASLGVYPMVPVYTVLYPVASLIQKLNHNFSRIFISQDAMNTAAFDKLELLDYVREGGNKGALKQVESSMLRRLISYKNEPVKSVLIPRQKVIGLDIGQLPENLHSVIKKFNSNTIPVYKNLKDNVVGIISKKKLFFRGELRNINESNFESHMEKPMLLPETRNLVDALRDMDVQNQEIAMVVDEYGGIEGMVTYVDIVQRLLGQQMSKQKSHIVRQNEQIFEIDALCSLDEFSDYFGVKLDHEKAETLAGYLIEQMHEIPKSGTVYKDNLFIFTILYATRRKVFKVQVQRLM